MSSFNEADVQKYLYAMGLEAVMDDADAQLDAALPDDTSGLSEYDIPEFELWKILKRKAVEKLRTLNNLTRYGSFIGSGINLPLDNSRHMFLDLMGTHEDGIFVLELKIDKAAERNAFTELFAYSNYIAGLFPGSGSKDILNILVTPMTAKIAKQAYLYDLIISDRNIILYQPEFPKGTPESLRLSLYIPEDEEFVHFANSILSHDTMSCVVASFPDLPGWIEYEDGPQGGVPSHSQKTLERITSYAAQLMENEGLHGFCYVRKRWKEIQMAIVGEPKSDLIICAVNPFRTVNDDRISRVLEQLAEYDRPIFVEAPQLGFDGRIIRVAKQTIADCLEPNYNVHLELPYWGGMVKEMVETVFAEHFGFRPTGMLREAYVESLAATRRYNSQHPAHAIDVERIQIDDIVNWLQAWVFMEACGFVAGEDKREL